MPRHCPHSWLISVTGELEEDVYFDQMNLLERLQSVLHKVDVGSSPTGKPQQRLTKEQIAMALRDFFPTKSEDDFHRLIVVWPRPHPAQRRR